MWWLLYTGAGAAGAKTLTADAGTYALTGTDAATTHQWKLDATTAGAYILTGTDANPTKVTGKFVTAESGVYVLTGTDVTLTQTINKALTADSGSYLLTGTDATLTKASNNKSLTADPGSYLLTGTAVTLISSAQPILPLRGEWPERKRRRRRDDARAESVQAARAARDALRASLNRLYEGGEYDAPALVEAEGEALATVNALNRLPYLPLEELRVAEELIISIQELVRQRLLDEARTDAAVAIAQQHLSDTIAIAERLYRKVRFNQLATVALLTAE